MLISFPVSSSTHSPSSGGLVQHMIWVQIKNQSRHDLLPAVWEKAAANGPRRKHEMVFVLFFSLQFSKCKNKYSWRNKFAAQKNIKSDCSLCAHFCSCNGKEVFLRLKQSKPISYDFEKKLQNSKKNQKVKAFQIVALVLELAKQSNTKQNPLFDQICFFH